MSTDYEYNLTISKVENNLVIFNDDYTDCDVAYVALELSLFVNYQYGSEIMSEAGQMTTGYFNWHDGAETIRIFSADNHGFLFALDEYNHDEFEWLRHYIYNGEVQTVVALMPPFDISKIRG